MTNRAPSLRRPRLRFPSFCLRWGNRRDRHRILGEQNHYVSADQSVLASEGPEGDVVDEISPPHKAGQQEHGGGGQRPPGRGYRDEEAGSRKHEPVYRAGAESEGVQACRHP